MILICARDGLFGRAFLVRGCLENVLTLGSRRILHTLLVCETARWSFN